MADISGVATYTFEGGRQVRLRKWSVRKFFTVVREVSSIADKIYPHITAGSKGDIIKAFSVAGENGLPVAARVIVESIDEPGETVETVMDWSLEDCLGLLRAVIDLNYTEGLVRNFRDLREAFKGKGPATKAADPAAASTT